MKIERARIVLERKGVVPREFVSRQIFDSWNRCLEMGLDPTRKPEPEILGRHDLENCLEENRSLVSFAALEMQNLYQQIAGSNFVILFADKNGVILKSILDASLDADSLECFTPGSIWSEKCKGTNALGTALACRQVSMVHAGEHFYRNYSGLTCTAAPIFGPGGELMAVLDAASDCNYRQYHTLALVKMSCRTIENSMFRRHYRDELVLEIHNRQEFLGTLQAGLMAFDLEGRLIAANQAARYFLQGIPMRDNVRFERIFRMGYDEFRDALYSRFQLWVSDLAGSTFAVRALNIPKRAETRISATRTGDPAEKAMRMVADDPALKAALNMAKKAAGLKCPILLHGETGTGKELMAHYVHQASGRPGRLVAVNCAAIPEALVESELFGYQGGSFTGASSKGAKGLVERADQGTLFLDEIGELPYPLQAKLLRFLDQWQVRPLGSGQGRRLDIQLVTATNRELKKAIEAKKFRADLYYRISTVTVELPPLRRRGDFDEIAQAILETFEYAPVIEPEAMDLLKSYHWPGNIRELKNLFTRLLVSYKHDVIGLDDMREVLSGFAPEFNIKKSGSTLLEQESEIIHQAYAQCRGNVSAAARKLGISRNKVYKILERKPKS
jgi:transcriptional regulator of acetoin/glycerol metabolism